MSVAEFSGEVHLVEPLVPSKRMLRAFQIAFGNDRPADGFRTSIAARVDKYREIVMANDVAMWNTIGGSVEVGKVLWHVSVASEVLTCMNKYDILLEEQRCLKCTFSHGPSSLIMTRIILCAATYAGADNETMTILKPLHCSRYGTI